MYTKGELIAETKHSDLGLENPRCVIGIKSGKMLFFTVSGDNSADNALRLVKCWNEHDELKKKADCHDDLLDTLSAVNNDTGDWLSGELDMPAAELIQAIHNEVGKAFEVIAKAESEV